MHTQMKHKCMCCGLHFILYTDRPEERKPEETYCPECGQQGIFLSWREDSDGFIFQHVPGENAKVIRCALPERSK